MKLKIKDYTKIIHRKIILDQINMTCSSGKIYGIVGENGSGKTMLFRAISGLIRPSEGHVLIDNQEIRKDIDTPNSIGALIENPSFIEKYTGYKNLKLLACLETNIQESDICTALEKIGLQKDDKRNYGKYSLGMKQRLGLACAFMGNPKLILLDEPFNALDEKSIKKARNMMIDARDKGSLIILACHNYDEVVSLSDEIYFMENGKIVKHEIIKEG